MIINLLALMCFTIALILLLVYAPNGNITPKRGKKSKKSPDQVVFTTFSKITKENKDLLKRLTDNPINHKEPFEDSSEFKLMEEMANIRPKIKDFTETMNSVGISLEVGQEGDISWEQYDNIVRAAKKLKKEGILTNEMIRHASPRGKATSNADLAAGFVMLACEDAAKGILNKTLKIFKVDSRKRITLGSLAKRADKVAMLELEDGRLELIIMPNSLQKQEDSQSWNGLREYPR